MEQSEVDRSNAYSVCPRCHMKFSNDDEHIKIDFGYNRLDIRCKTCVKCRTCNRGKANYRNDLKQQIETYGSYDPNRNKKQCGKIQKRKSC